LRDVLGLADDRRGQFPHPPWSHPLDPRAAARPFIAQALAAAQRAGGVSRSERSIGPGHRSRFGKGSAHRSGQPAHHRALARRRREGARRPPRARRAAGTASRYLRREA
jgi:hypothetical protein